MIHVQLGPAKGEMQEVHRTRAC